MLLLFPGRMNERRESVKEVRESEFIATLPALNFVQAVKEVAFAAATDDSRPVLKGVVFYFAEEGLTLVAADGFRLSSKRIIESPFTPGEIIIDAKRLKGVCKYLFLKGRETKNDQIELSTGTNGIEIRSVNKDKGVIIPRIEGRYPDWKELIPQPTEGVIFERIEFLRKLNKMSKVAIGWTPRIEFLADQGRLRIWGEVEEEDKKQVIEEFLPVEGQLLSKVAFFDHHLFQLRHIRSDKLRMESSSPSSPVVFRNPKDVNFVHVVLPVFVQW